MSSFPFKFFFMCKSASVQAEMPCWCNVNSSYHWQKRDRHAERWIWGDTIHFCIALPIHSPKSCSKIVIGRSLYDKIKYPNHVGSARKQRCLSPTLKSGDHAMLQLSWIARSIPLQMMAIHWIWQIVCLGKTICVKQWLRGMQGAVTVRVIDHDGWWCL